MYFFVEKPTKELLRMAYCTISWHRNGIIPSTKFPFGFIHQIVLIEISYQYSFILLKLKAIWMNLEIELQTSLYKHWQKIVCIKYTLVHCIILSRDREKAEFERFYPTQCRIFELSRSFYELTKEPFEVAPCLRLAKQRWSY